MSFLDKIFGRNKKKEEAPPMRGAPPPAPPEYGQQREARASMEADVARDRAKRGIVDPPPAAAEPPKDSE